MTLFLIALGTFFIVSMIGYVIVLSRMKSGESLAGFAQDPMPEFPGLPALPPLLFLSTLLMIAGSALLHFGKLAIRAGSARGLQILAVLGMIFGFGFLALQTICWVQWYDDAEAVFEIDAYRFAGWGFIVLSGIHAAHVIGGIMPLIVVVIRSFFGAYTAESHGGMTNVVVYWHFLDVVWIVMFLILLVST